ncbi:MAG: hypothetical protein AAFX40_19830, partial [Cyanobacteria bacterium J06639_1]
MMALSLAVKVMYNSGVIQLSCERTSSKEARCVVRRSHLFGLISRPSQTRSYDRVTGASRRTWRDWQKEEDTPFGSWVALRTHAGEVPVFGDFRLHSQNRIQTES